MTPAQITQYKATVQADIIASPDLSAQPQTADGAFEIARLYNLASSVAPSTALLLWDKAAQVGAIEGAITRSAFTPNDTPDGTAIFTNRAAVIQIKQANLAAMLASRSTVDATKSGFRVSLRDAVINLPAGAAGAAVSAGGASGVTVLTACTRTASRIEKLLAGASDPLGGVTASVPGFEGQVTYTDIQAMR